MANKQNPRRVSNQEFFAICEEVRNRREEVMRDCHNLTQLCELIKARTGHEVGESTASDVLAATKIELTRTHGGTTVKKKLYNTRVLAQSLAWLYKKLGEEVPADLAQLLLECNKGARAASETQPPPQGEVVQTQTLSDGSRKVVQPVPLKSVPASNTVPVVNKRV